MTHRGMVSVVCQTMRALRLQCIPLKGVTVQKMKAYSIVDASTGATLHGPVSMLGAYEWCTK